LTKIGIIIGSTRPGRKVEVVTKWAYDIALKRNNGEFERPDVADFTLPLFHEPMWGMFGQRRASCRRPASVWPTVFLHLSNSKHSMLTE